MTKFPSRFLLLALLIGCTAVASTPAKPEIIEVPKSKEFSLTPYGLEGISLKVVRSTSKGIVCQVINHSTKEDRTFQNRTGGYYTKKLSPSQTLDLPYDIPVPGTVSKGALLLEIDGVKVYATNLLTSMNKVKMAIFKATN